MVGGCAEEGLVPGVALPVCAYVLVQPDRLGNVVEGAGPASLGGGNTGSGQGAEKHLACVAETTTAAAAAAAAGPLSCHPHLTIAVCVSQAYSFWKFVKSFGTFARQTATRQRKMQEASDRRIIAMLIKSVEVGMKCWGWGGCKGELRCAGTSPCRGNGWTVALNPRAGSRIAKEVANAPVLLTNRIVYYVLSFPGTHEAAQQHGQHFLFPAEQQRLGP
jgi:hypothetical protein